MSITLIIIIITVIASYSAWKRQDLAQKWIMNPYVVHQRNEYHRFLTSGFIHADQAHLFFNMFTFYFFGEMVEHIYGILFGEDLGKLLFVGLYLMGIIISSIPSYLKHKNNSWYNSLGASGGVAAIVFSSILMNPTEKIYIYAIIGIPGFIAGALYVLYSVYQSKRMADNINHDAHLFGALFGVVFTLAIKPDVLPFFISQILSYRFF
ncbi:rhomboid family intramembrane serine protease [Xanthovirga aplysinae]|uniref:rhomboid family intramembrane serine protease n=1 Tax=Xanthovirga aplysinae TaxID=2529853 RepID=UPI0012BC499A|nr:rhomboid family intramembrane serine protease [Xanthovirga aplysinae]MTI31381.1 rhomboid family intramembrane serine protease [Xanthovirga aplysinae]